MDDAGVALESLDLLVHGTTTTTNAVLERKLARTGLITTRGFRDILELGRRTRPKPYGLTGRFEPLITRDLRLEVSERMDADGKVVTPLDESELLQAVEQLQAMGCESLVIHFLHAYRNPEHERTVRQIVMEELPGLPVTLSSELAPEWREYERTSTTVVSAYVAPIVGEYLAEIEERLAAEGMRCPVLVMQSNGGIMSADVARAHPVQTLLSGPVGGTTAGVAVAAGMKDSLGSNLICVDMGGTSFDVSLVVGGEPQVELQSTIDGHELLAPAVAIHTVGAGGGSIAHLQAGGLRVGPRSAGAEPGPACYGRGGLEPTVTDANLALGRLPAAALLGGSLGLGLGRFQLDLGSRTLGSLNPFGGKGVGLVAGLAIGL